MRYIATITDAQFLPMVTAVYSTLQFWIPTEDPKIRQLLTFSDTIDNLKKRFEFKVEGTTYDLRGLNGRQCNILFDEDGYHFISFVSKRRQ